MKENNFLKGIIIKGVSGFYFVETDIGVFECKARGSFRKEKITPLVGDRVHISVKDENATVSLNDIIGDGAGNKSGSVKQDKLNEGNAIEEILPRKNFLTRPPVANIDKLIIVVSSIEPRPNTLLIDRLTAIAVKRDIEPVIVLNKSDLAGFDDLFEAYKLSGFETIIASGKTGEGVDDIRKLLCGNVSAFTGNSGVGKSTLLNQIDPSLGLATQAISQKLGRGKHTTRECTLHKVGGGYVADTPGFASLELLKNEVILKDDLPFCFPEFESFMQNCRFYPNCSHMDDKACAVRAAAEAGSIAVSRYQSYRDLYTEVKDIREWHLK